MNGFVRAILACALALHFSAVFGQIHYQDSIVAEYVEHSVNIVSPQGSSGDQEILYYPGASFIKVHFKTFHLPPGMIIEVRNPSGTESYMYSREVMDAHTFDSELGDDGISSFYAMSITGDTAIIEVHGKPGHVKSTEKAARKSVFVDHVVRGFEQMAPKVENDEATGNIWEPVLQSLGAGDSSTESTCGVLERYDAVCWAGSDPAAYDRSRPVAKVVVGISACTAWRVGSDNHMFTNNHCIDSKTKTSAAEVWFNYERTVCGGEATESIVKVSGDQLISTDYTLDYTLFSVNDFASIESFGNLGLEVREASVGEVIYIPQHGAGDPKQIAIESDMNVGGSCQVDDDNYTGRAEGSNIGYYCDTTGGSSGSPVLLSESNKAIALHHAGGCFNSGVKMSLIWPKVARHFGREVPEGDFDPANLPGPPGEDADPVASFGFSCSYLECSFDGSGSSDTEGALASYEWNFGDGSAASGVSASHTFASAGSYSVSLTVTDSAGNTDSEVKTVTVSEPNQNQAPQAEFAFSCNALDCSFDAAGSSDPEGAIISYSWSFGDGLEASGISPSHSYGSAGSYSVTLTVEDAEGATDSVTRTVTVESAPPVASNIELTAVGMKVKGVKRAELSWSGTEAGSVRIFRDGAELVVIENTGTYFDLSVEKRAKRAVYQVCEVSGGTCSDLVEVAF